MKKIRFLALLLALTLLLCACGAKKTPLEQTASYLRKSTPEPTFGSLIGDWTVFGLARSGVKVPANYYETYYKNVTAAVTEAGGRLSETKYTEYSRLVLALTAIGRDPRDVGGYDLLMPLADFDRTPLCRRRAMDMWQIFCPGRTRTAAGASRAERPMLT